MASDPDQRTTAPRKRPVGWFLALGSLAPALFAVAAVFGGRLEGCLGASLRWGCGLMAVLWTLMALIAVVWWARVTRLAKRDPERYGQLKRDFDEALTDTSALRRWNKRRPE